ncbi:c-type cytochrome [Robertkochia solimangrovi]|uniref:c-type cytochrome n=1 Tax=Robertkochia solimangrovi TaxID=2213046 RepID=UPI0011808905|nr:cytochrome c [Robertkochia solimangrovi]TRZ42846.1 cytochrome c [Robertkochia solimangrovi]
MIKTLFIYILLTGILVWNVYPEQKFDLQKSIKQGEKIYQTSCATCHQVNGQGVNPLYPPLANSDYLLKNREASIKAVKYGQQGKITVNGKVYNNMMIPMGLNDEQVADVMNYILNSWGNKAEKPVTPAEVTAVKK